MSQLNTLLESAAGSWKSVQSDAARLAGKWEATGLLEGMNGQASNNMSMLLENQAKQLVVEASNTAGAAISDTNNFSGTGAQWAGVNLPSGLVFYLDFQYGDSKAPFASGDSLYGDASTGFGNAAEGGLYGAGRYSYSTNTHTSSSAYSTSSVSFQDVEYDSDYLVTGSYSKVTLSVESISGSIDTKAVRSFMISSSAIAVDKVLSQFTTYNVSNGDLSFIVEGTNFGASGTATLYYSKVTSAVERGDFEDGNSFATDSDWDSSTADISIPEINIQMKSEAIVAKTKKLKAVWTPEFAQDLNAYQSVDAEAEVTNMLSEYISLEIDLEILDMLISDAAAGDEFWSAVNNRTISAGDSADDFGNAGFYNTQGQWFQTLGTKMQKLSNIIHQRTLRGGANFMVVSPTVATIIESIPGFASNSDGDVSKASYAFGVQKAGQMNSRYTVYKNPYMKENTILMGFRGSQFLEAY